MLADMTAVAGDRYNYGIDEKKSINVFVDEAAEVINNPTIQLLNKGRGAGFKMYIATQTFADFASRLGDENKARQVLANTNNKIALRILDAETQQYIADGIPTWTTYVVVIIPMMRPVFITTLVIVASGIIRLYDLVVAMTSGGPGGNASQVPAMYVYDYMFQAQNLGQGFAASTMMLLSVLIVLIPWAYLEFGGKKRG